VLSAFRSKVYAQSLFTAEFRQRIVHGKLVSVAKSFEIFFSINETIEHGQAVGLRALRRKLNGSLTKYFPNLPWIVRRMPQLGKKFIASFNRIQIVYLFRS
jgi:hypothetical protein